MGNAVKVPYIKPIDLSGVSRSLDNIFSGGQRLTDEVTDLGKKAVRIGAAIATEGASEVAMSVGGVSDEGKRLRQDFKTGIEDLTGVTQKKQGLAFAQQQESARAQAESEMKMRSENMMKFAQMRTRQRSLSGGALGRSGTILTSGLGGAGAAQSSGKTLLGM